MSNYKKIVAILITVAIMLTSFPLSGFVFAHAEDFVEETNGYTRGDIIEFGSYPQSKMTDEDLIETLNALAADLTWNVTGSEESKNELEYIDVEYSGEKYRAVKFSYYTHEFSGYLDGAGNESTKNYQELNGYLIDTVYWFKFEPLKWKVLDPETGLVLCESIIDANAFNDILL